MNVSFHFANICFVGKNIYSQGETALRIYIVLNIFIWKEKGDGTKRKRWIGNSNSCLPSSIYMKDIVHALFHLSKNLFKKKKTKLLEVGVIIGHFQMKKLGLVRGSPMCPQSHGRFKP